MTKETHDKKIDTLIYIYKIAQEYGLGEKSVEALKQWQKDPKEKNVNVQNKQNSR